MTDYSKWNSFDVDQQLKELNEGDESDDLSQDLDALVCTIHKKKFRSGDTCPLCRKALKQKDTKPAKVTNKASPSSSPPTSSPSSSVSSPSVSLPDAPLVDVTEAEKLKGSGNEHVIAQRWDEALKAYNAALALLPPRPHPRQLETVNALRLALNLNLGHVALKQEQWSEAVSCCSAALEIEPGNRKALFRRGVAFTRQNANPATANTRQLKQACRDLDTAGCSGPPGKEISQALTAARERLEAQERYEREGLGIERLKKDIEDLPDDQVSIPALMKQMEAMSRQLPGSTLAKAMDDIRSKPR